MDWYDVVFAHDIGVLIQSVNEALRNRDWEAAGGIAVVVTTDHDGKPTTDYYQAIRRKNP